MNLTDCRFGVIQALAWRVVAELFRRHAHAQRLQVLELHPGISVRGQLRLAVGASAIEAATCLTFNFGGPAGTCDADGPKGPLFTGFDFITPMFVDDPAATVDRLEAALGLHKPTALPPSSPTVLAVRLVADVLSHEWQARVPLRATSAWVDASAGCSIAIWTNVFGSQYPTLRERYAEGQVDWQEACGQTSRFVALHEAPDEAPLIDDQRPLAAIDLQTGQVRLGGSKQPGEAWALDQRYAACGRRLGPLTDRVLQHLRR